MVRQLFLLKKKNWSQICIFWHWIPSHTHRITCQKAMVQIGYVALVTITGSTALIPSFNHVTVTYLKSGYSIFKWVAVTWQGWVGTRIVFPAVATRWHAHSLMDTYKGTHAWHQYVSLHVQPSLSISYLFACCHYILKIHSLNMLNVSHTVKSQYSLYATSMPCLLMPWCLLSPGHQQLWYWLWQLSIL